MPQYRLNDLQPKISLSAFIAPDATLVGDVTVGDEASFWFQSMARGDNAPIHVGDHSNIQEGAVLHADPGFPLTIGSTVTVGHQAMLHGCTIGEGSLIGIQAVVLNGARIGKNCLVGAGAVVTERKEFADRSLILGAPAKAVRQLTDAEVAGLVESAANYVRRAREFRSHLVQVC